MNKSLPVLLLKSLVLLPYQDVRLELNNQISKNIIDLSIKDYENNLLVVCPKDEFEETPDASDLSNTGVVGKIKSRICLPNGNYRVVISGVERVIVDKYVNSDIEDSILLSYVNKIEDEIKNEVEEIALIRKLNKILIEFINANINLSNSILSSVKSINSLSQLTDVIGAFIPFDFNKKLELMECVDSVKRADFLIHNLSIELEIIKLESKIEKNLKNELEESQKNFILREKIKEIQKEIGEVDLKSEDVEEFKLILSKLKINKKTKEKINNEINRFQNSNEMSPDNGVIRNYLDTILNLPWNIFTKDEENIKKIQKSLDNSHYGLEKIKERILEYIAVKTYNKNIKSPIICLVGPPGTGKTSLAISIAKSLNKQFYKISVGGLNDANELLGHRRTYIGACPGKIIQGLNKCKSSNPLFLIDEVDKMVKDYKGDPASALLEIVDPEQNNMFTDNFIEEPFDLSKIFFIITANNINDIPLELLDRLEIINLSSYTEFEKLHIAKEYIIPKLNEDYKIKTISFTNDAILSIIKNYTKESGVRELERIIDKIIRKIITENVINNNSLIYKITKKDLIKYLDYPIYEEITFNNNNIGVCNGLAYTPLGGTILPLECIMYKGESKILLTGSLGEVMKESIEIALSFIKSNYKLLGIDEKIFNNKILHFNAIQNAIKKEGPSAGVTIVTSILSLIKEIKIDKNIAMTGELTLSGIVLKVGGIKEKIIGGYNNGINKFFIPYENKIDIEEIPKNIINKIEIIYIKNYFDIFNILFKKQ